MNYGPCLENIVYIYARSHDYAVSIGRIGKLECDFILRDNELNYSYRNSLFKNSKIVILGIWFRFDEEARDKLEDIRNDRIEYSRNEQAESHTVKQP